MSDHERYARAPLMLYWEMTRACDLACRHCRAEAIPTRDPRELTTNEGKNLLDSICSFGDPKPHVVFTGGDPLKRPDLYTLVEYAVDLGLTTSVVPSGTPSCTKDSLRRIYATGCRSVAFSLDGSSAAKHDRIRCVDGSYHRTIGAIKEALECGFVVQVNSLVAAETVDDLEAIYHCLIELGVQRWALFFLIRTGRGAFLSEVEPDVAESTLEWLYGCSQQAPLVIKTTEAPHYRRIAIQRKPTSHHSANDRTSPRRAWGIRDGAGIMFVSHIGDVYPSGFLPISVGNIREDDLIHLYRDCALFQQLRDPDRLKGKCGQCEFRFICGGSRARAYAMTSDPLESDPLCSYVPSADAALSTVISRVRMSQ